MSLNLRELEYFVAVAEQRHFGRASKQVNVSQPTLSMQLKKLEERLGAKLIERLPKDALLTSFGAELLPIARQILELASDIESRSNSKGKHTRLRLGVIPTLSPYLLPKINRGLSRDIDGRKVSIVEAQTADLVRFVRDGTIDVGIVSTPLKERGIEEIEVFSEPFYLAVNRSHPLAKKKRVGLDDLKDQKLLLLGEGHCLRKQALALCSSIQTGNDTDLSATSIETLRSMVAMGAGVTLIPKLAVRRGEDVCYLPFAEASTSRSIGLIFRPSFPEKELIRSIANSLTEVAQLDNMIVLGGTHK